MLKDNQFFQPVGICCGSSLSSLGEDGDQIRRSLISQKNKLTRKSDLLLNRSAYVGMYQGEIFSEIFSTAFLRSIDSRNFRLAITALEKIKKDILEKTSSISKKRLAIIVGTSTSGIADNEEPLKHYFLDKQTTNVFYKKQEMGCLAEGLKDYLGWEGIAYTISTACSSSAKAFAAGQRLLNADLADAVLVGGVDTLSKLTLNGFDSLASLSNDICSPCGADRDGINIGEAASLFLLSREKMPVMFLGSGETMDAWHISAPHPEGTGAKRAMQKALSMANISASQVDYLNLHGTATPQNDAMEIKAVREVFNGTNVKISSTKHQTGHCLGAAGALEAFICYQVLKDQSWLPLHKNVEIDRDLSDQNYVTDFNKKSVSYTMSNSFAFGGNNISLIFGVNND